MRRASAGGEQVQPSTSSLRQVFVESNSGAQGNDLERELFLLRKCIEKEKILRFAAVGAEPADFYVCTFSNKTIVYKVGVQLCRMVPTGVDCSLYSLAVQGMPS